jgi:hypothetical protein
VRSAVTRLRQLTPRQAQGLEGLRKVAQLLDSAFVVPGTSYRVGLDPILGLVPGLGDLVSPLFTIGILWQARELAIPRVVLLRMILNVAIDSLLGAVPVVGDLFDFAWKANNKNLALVERHAQEERTASAGDWLFVGLTVVSVLFLAIIPFVIVGWLVATAARYIF